MEPDGTSVYAANMSGTFLRGGVWRRIASKLVQYAARKLPLLPRHRVWLQQWRGVRFADPGKLFIGENVYFDEMFPENIQVGADVMITEGAMILCHHYDPSYAHHVQRIGKVVIEDGVYIGSHAIIVKPVVIGKGAVIAAHAVVTHDVPPGVVVGGIPAKPIGHRGDKVLGSE